MKKTTLFVALACSFMVFQTGFATKERHDPLHFYLKNTSTGGETTPTINFKEGSHYITKGQPYDNTTVKGNTITFNAGRKNSAETVTMLSTLYDYDQSGMGSGFFPSQLHYIIHGDLTVDNFDCGAVVLAQGHSKLAGVGNNFYMFAVDSNGKKWFVVDKRAAGVTKHAEMKLSCKNKAGKVVDYTFSFIKDKASADY